ncbi:MAG TPA: MBOAT family protein [Gemmatimonadaceae bacterium]|jgi:D-alanyl-lipoteichoic acid acyltransferase DltB (MBOAT superfamily)
MLFNSLEFLLFFPLVTAVYFALPHRGRISWLLIASCYFYSAFIPGYLLILFVLIGVDYTAGLLIEPAKGRRRRAILIVSLAANLGILCVFKYFNFAGANITALFEFLRLPWVVPHLSIILPIGLSFHTFQSMAYTIEVYRGKVPAERDLRTYALYVLFYPQMIAGPIERPQHLLAEFHTPRTFDWARVIDGLTLMLWGLWKKIVVADRLALYVNAVYDQPRAHGGTSLLIATYFFAWQIYCDFSGYSDVARGAARVMGYELMLNFDRPYAARSVSEFWHRWHISLSTWFRDYLYIPLGGSRVRMSRRVANLLIVFVVSGLWHGANWTFVAWGALHGLYIVADTLSAKRQHPIRTAMAKFASPRVLAIIQTVVTFHLVVIAWVFFRAASISDAFYVLRHLLDFGHPSSAEIPAAVTGPYFALSVVLIVVMELAQYWVRGDEGLSRLVRGRPFVLTMYGYAIALSLLAFGMFSRPSQFIYFQF